MWDCKSSCQPFTQAPGFRTEQLQVTTKGSKREEKEQIISVGRREGALQTSHWALGQCFRVQLHLRLWMAQALVKWFDFCLHFKLWMAAVSHTLEKERDVKSFLLHLLFEKLWITLDWDNCVGCRIQFNESQGGYPVWKHFNTAFDTTVISTLSFVRIHSADQFRHQ